MTGSAASPRILVIGAGAVGQVYGHHLQRGGAAVTFFVREKYAAAARAGFVLYPLNRREESVPVRWRDFDVVTDVAAVRAGTWDFVLLTVSSTALRGAWLGEPLAATGDAVVVMLQPGLEDRALVTAHVPDARVVSGLITILSYAAPLPGETRFPEPGMAYWFPPLSPGLFSGPRPATDTFVALLRRGGQPARRIRDVPSLASFPTAVLMPWLAALELAGWRFAALPSSDFGALGARGAREALAIVARESRRWPGPFLLGASRWLLFLGVWLARFVMPLDVETYVREHFQKVGDQTRLLMGRYVELGRAAKLPILALERLTSGLGASDRPRA